MNLKNPKVVFKQLGKGGKKKAATEDPEKDQKKKKKKKLKKRIEILQEPRQEYSEPTETPMEVVSSDSKVLGTTSVSKVVQSCEDIEMSDVTTPRLVIEERSATPSTGSSDLINSIVANSGLSESGPTMITCGKSPENKQVTGDSRPINPSGESASSASTIEDKISVKERGKRFGNARGNRAKFENSEFVPNHWALFSN